LVKHLKEGLLVVEYGALYESLRSVQEDCLDEMLGETWIYQAACQFISLCQANSISIVVVLPCLSESSLREAVYLDTYQILRARAQLNMPTVREQRDFEINPISMSAVAIDQIDRAIRENNVAVVQADADTKRFVASIAVEISVMKILS